MSQPTPLTDKQYNVLLNLYNEYFDAFLTLSDKIKEQFFARLYSKE